MLVRFVFFFLMLNILFGCSSMRPSDFKNSEPKLLLENYFLGETHAAGIFEDRFGNVRRQFSVLIKGTWDGKTLTLDEKFEFSDGEKNQRIWYITKIGENLYTGEAADVIGIAKGEVAGNALNWKYDMNLKTKLGVFKVAFDDWMFLQHSGILLNRAEVNKFGINLGTVTIAFTKLAETKEVVNNNLLRYEALSKKSEQPSDYR